jgi:hypothetical protein
MTGGYAAARRLEKDMKRLLCMAAFLAAVPVGGAALAQDGAPGYPRFFDPRLRCHDAPHRPDTEAAFPARISVLPGGACVVRQETGPYANYQLQGFQIIEPPAEGRLIRRSPTTYVYQAPRGGSGFDSFIIRLLYEGPTGRLIGPQLEYEVRIGR